MSFKYIAKLPSVEETLTELPMDDGLKAIKAARDKELKAIFEGKSDKFVLIIGPCSASHEDAVCDYIHRLKTLQDKVKDKLFLVPRVYTNKPRTTGEGYKGMGHQPDLSEEPNMIAGLKAIRKMHLRAIRESGLTAADEVLYPENSPYLADVLSYVAVGARSVENQQHRLTASGFDIPVGMKNPTSGDIPVMLNSITAAQLPHEFIYAGYEVKSSGNPLAHAILRGAFTPYGRNLPNYHYDELMFLFENYQKRDLVNQAVVVDCNHANSAKKFEAQPRIAREVLNSRNYSPDLKKMVKGLMIESFLVEGAQPISEGIYGKSITDACLGWEASEKLVLDLADHV